MKKESVFVFGDACSDRDVLIEKYMHKLFLVFVEINCLVMCGIDFVANNSTFSVFEYGFSAFALISFFVSLWKLIYLKRSIWSDDLQEGE